MKKSINLEIGERIRKSRIAVGLSREKLSELIGVSALFLGYIECGQRGMSISTLQKLCKTLNVSADYILLGKTPSDDKRTQLCELIDDIDEKYLPLAIEHINNFKKIIAVKESDRTDSQSKPEN